MFHVVYSGGNQPRRYLTTIPQPGRMELDAGYWITLELREASKFTTRDLAENLAKKYPRVGGSYTDVEVVPVLQPQPV